MIRIILVLIFSAITIYFGILAVGDSMAYNEGKANIQKYGCPKPVVKPDLVWCPR